MLKPTKQEKRTSESGTCPGSCEHRSHVRVSLRLSLVMFLSMVSLIACQVITPKLNAQENHQSLISREYEIKAAYIYNFCKYVQWPQNNNTNSSDKEPFYICILGDNPFGKALDRIAEKKTVRGRRIVVRHVTSANDLRSAHILFVPADRPDEMLDGLMQKTEENSTLIIGEEPGFATTSGIINFFQESNKVRFEINAKAAENRDLKISAKLLRLGKIIEN